MKLGVVPVGAGDGGGVYQYSLAFLEALAVSRRNDDIAIISWEQEVAGTQPLIERGARLHVLRRPLWRVALRSSWDSLARVSRALRVTPRPGPGTPGTPTRIGHPGRFVASSVVALGLDVIVELGYTGYGLAAGVPFVMPVHDIQHRLQPEFPEVGSPDEWAARDAFLTRAFASASMILVDSEVGRADILEHYGEHIGADRIAVLPFVPAPYLEKATAEDIATVRRTYRLPERYLLFPAQFWPHKNHLRVVEALALPECENLQVVMTGGGGDEHRDRTMAEVRDTIARHGLEQRTRILGHVPDDDMSALYCGSAGVILPTFFGPTNIPVVEAWSLGIPVLTSDIPGIREQSGEAAVLVDPRSVEAIADGMATLWRDERERARLIEAGSTRVRSWTSQDFSDALAGVLDELEARLARGPTAVAAAATASAREP